MNTNFLRKLSVGIEVCHHNFTCALPLQNLEYEAKTIAPLELEFIQ